MIDWRSVGYGPPLRRAPLLQPPQPPKPRQLPLFPRAPEVASSQSRSAAASASLYPSLGAPAAASAAAAVNPDCGGGGGGPEEPPRRWRQSRVGRSSVAGVDLVVRGLPAEGGRRHILRPSVRPGRVVASAGQVAVVAPVMAENERRGEAALSNETTEGGDGERLLSFGRCDTKQKDKQLLSRRPCSRWRRRVR